MMKATAQEYALHERICARGDPVAFARLAESLYFSLLQEVQQRAGYNADSTLVEEAVGQALINYRDAPERFDPDRGCLQSYLAMVAHRDFLNAQAKERRIQHHQISLFEDDSYRRCIELQARLLAKYVTGEIEQYPPFLNR